VELDTGEASIEVLEWMGQVIGQLQDAGRRRSAAVDEDKRRLGFGQRPPGAQNGLVLVR